MKQAFSYLGLIVLAATSVVAHAGSEITPGGYLLEDPYAEYIGTPPHIDETASGCFYIHELPTEPNGAFSSTLAFDSGFLYELECTRAAKGNVKHSEGQAPKVKVDLEKSKHIVCVGEEKDNPFLISFNFKIAGKGEKARLLNGQVFSNKGENILFPKKISLNNTECSPG